MLAEYKDDDMAASKKMTELGFRYLYERGDLVTAMRRFNQAYLLNTSNADIYYGYGTVYFNLGQYGKAREQYDKGLKLNPKHDMMLTDYGTTYLGGYYHLKSFDEELAVKNLVRALEYLDKANDANKQNSNTQYKLSIVHIYLGDCKQAWRYYKKAKKDNNPNIKEAFEKELGETCKEK